MRLALKREEEPMKKNKIPTTFSVDITEPVAIGNKGIVKARAKIFYRGCNRNGSYITKDFAEKLISSINYVPVKGIYENGFLGHGDSSALGRAYGVVPKEHNFAWETYKDEDGVFRDYACVDVYLWTMYRETNEIIGSPQSMELNPDTIDGEWVEHNDQSYFQFSNAELLGLQVLGKDIEPCFEGASFYQYSKKIEDLIYEVVAAEIAKYTLGGKEMDKQAVAQDEIRAEEILEEEAVDNNIEEETQEVEEEKINDASEEVEEEAEEVVEVEEESEVEEKNEAEELPEENFDEKVEKNEVEEKLSTLQQDFEILQGKFNELEEENKSLREYKAQAEDEKKEGTFDRYSELLSEEVIADFKSKRADYSVDELEKELAYTVMKTSDYAFSKKETSVVLVDDSDSQESGVIELLNKNRQRKQNK